MPSYIVKRKLTDGGYTKVGTIRLQSMHDNVEPPDPKVVAGKVLGAVTMAIDDNYTGKLYFSDQDPSENNYGQEIVADEMYQLIQWVKEGKEDIYFFDKA